MAAAAPAPTLPGEWDLAKRGRTIDAHSAIENLCFFGEHYSACCEQVTGARTIGGVLEHFSGKDMRDTITDVYRSCRNVRAGEECPDGNCVNNHNPHAAMTLFRLLLCGRRSPELFPGYDVHIAIKSADLIKLYQQEKATTPARKPRLTKRQREEQRRKAARQQRRDA